MPRWAADELKKNKGKDLLRVTCEGWSKSQEEKIAVITAMPQGQQ